MAYEDYFGPGDQPMVDLSNSAETYIPDQVVDIPIDSSSWASDIISGVDLVSSFANTPIFTTTGSAAQDIQSWDTEAPESLVSPIKKEDGFFDKLLSSIASVKPDTWANLAGMAIKGFASGQAAKQNQVNLERDYQLKKEKQDNAIHSAEGLKAPSIISSYKSRFLQQRGTQ